MTAPTPEQRAQTRRGGAVAGARMMDARGTAAKRAAEALSDLNAFYAIIAICEGGCFHAVSNSAVQRIITICKMESGKRLRESDRELAKVERGDG